MSRIGKQPVPITGGVSVKVDGGTVKVTGKNGELTYDPQSVIDVRVDDEANSVIVERRGETKKAKALHGTTRALIANMIHGAAEGYRRDLDITGVGWTAQVQGKKINLNVGYADTRVLDIPDGVDVQVQGPRITVTGADKQLVGQVAAVIRGQRPPEPYNGKGIKYADEQIARKEGKAFAGG